MDTSTTQSPDSLGSPSGCVNRGLRWDRTAHNPREKALADKWEEENEPNPGLNYGHGILQDLFGKWGMFGPAGGSEVSHVITDRERMIVATVVQWFGSNCGWGFLEEALKKCGYRIVRIDPGKGSHNTKS